QIKEMIDYVKNINPKLIVFVDNCYGEFVEEIEPPHVGADIIAGSLIKNPGGGLVRAGGYIAGTEEFVLNAANRLTAPGLGKETGATLNMLQERFECVFISPHVVGESIKGIVIEARNMELIGYQVKPVYNEKRTYLIQTIKFENDEKMIKFCQNIQKGSPVNSYVEPYPSEM